MWEGEYHVAPEAHGRHGDVDDQLAAFLRPRARAAGLWGSGPLNLGTPEDYRVPSTTSSTRRPEPAEGWTINLRRHAGPIWLVGDVPGQP